MYKWQTDGSISWKDGYATVEPDLPFSASSVEWATAYGTFGPSGSASWSLLGIINEIVSYVSSLPTGRYWLNPVLDSTILNPVALTPSDGDRYLINGTGAGGWAGHDNCIAQYDGSLAAWVYYAVDSTPPFDIGDGASTWDALHNTYWVMNALTPTTAEWIQCGGTTLEKQVYVSALGPYYVDSMVDRGTTFIGGPGGGTTTFVLPACMEGLVYRFIRDSATGTANHVDVAVLAGEALGIYLTQRQFELDAAGTPIILDQIYRKVRLTSRFDAIVVLGTKHGWVIIDGEGAVQDLSPQHDGTAQGASDNTHITLEATASASNEDYVGRLIYIKTCSGVPAAVEQIRLITAYNGTSKVATVSPAWTTTPDATAAYDMVRYDALPVSPGEIGSIYANPKKDLYSITGAAFSKSNFPTMSRYVGLNMTDTWGALLLGRHQHAEEGAKFATAFGEYAHARWDNQMVFGDLPLQNYHNVLDPGLCQVSRVILGARVGTTADLALGTGHGETTLTIAQGKAYYVTYEVVASVYAAGNVHLISWSGSFVAAYNPGTHVLGIVPGSDNQVETANVNVLGKALELEIDVGAGIVRFEATNTYPYSQAQFVGFADVIELEYFDQVS